MNNSTKRQEMLMRYLDDEMNEGEKRDFEELLAADALLRAELENLQLASAAVKSFGLKQQVAGVHNEMMKELNIATVRIMGKFRRILRYGVAAAAGLLLIAGAYLAYLFFSLSPEKLYSKKYMAYEPAALRDTGVREESAIEKAYREKDFAGVIRLNAASVPRAKDIFLTGISYLETGDASRAAASFQNALAAIEKNGPAGLKDETEYYMALAHLKNRDYDQAIELMVAIHDNPSHTYREKFTRKFIREVKMLKWK
jgi:hypothetical protein